MGRSVAFNLGAWRDLAGTTGGNTLWVPAHHLVTHGVVVGMTGSGKTGLLTVLVEEALGAGVPVIVIDVKGDLPNLLLAFPTLAPGPLVPWVEAGPEDEESSEELAKKLADERRQALAAWSIGEPELRKYCDKIEVRVLTPGATAGEPLHVLSALERRSDRWDRDPESARDALGAAVSLVLRLLGRDADPAKSREHVLLSVLAERRLLAGQNAELSALLQDLRTPPISEIGALPMDSFLRKTEREKLAAALNALLASPSFAHWRQGATLDVGEWVTPKDGRTPGVIVSVAHLDDEERALVLGVVLEEILSWVRTLPGSKRLRALVVFDEVYGFLPPHPANPPTKRPIVSLMKQARAFGVGVVVATQNPMDLDYRALSNAGLWCIGRLQTDADRARVLDGLASADDGVGAIAHGEANGPAGNGVTSPGGPVSEINLAHALPQLAPRWFVVRNAQVQAPPLLLQPRYAMSLLRGPMTRVEIHRALEDHKRTTQDDGQDSAKRTAR